MGTAVDSESLPPSDRRDVQLLRSLLDSLREQPDVSTAALLGFWHGTKEGQLLADLAGREPIEDPEGLTALVNALVHQICRAGPLAELRQQADVLKAKPYDALTPEEKQSLVRLTQEIRALMGKG